MLYEVITVLDNFEQVAACAPDTLGRWLELAGEARFVVKDVERGARQIALMQSLYQRCFVQHRNNFV